MRRISLSGYTISLIGIAATVLGLSIVASLVPDSSYLRFQLLNDKNVIDARWIYERIHFDARPIDVLFVGASNTKYGISADRLEKNFAERGLSVKVENFSVLFGGRNLNYVLMKEMYKAGRQPKLLVIGVARRPAHFGHPAFKYFADANDIVAPAYPVNLDYLSDLQYLPFRQMKLAAMYLFPDVFAASLKFDQTLYTEREEDPPGLVQHLRNGTLVGRDEKLSGATFLKEAESTNSWNEQILPNALMDVEFGDEKYYIPKIAALARAHKTKVAFVYVPNFQGPADMLFENFYRHYGPVFKANLVANNDQLYFDLDHLNTQGALVATDWLTDQVAAMLGD